MDTSLIPPSEMLYDGSSSTQQFVDFGEGFPHILIPRAGLQPSDVFFDLGCGNGSVARALTAFLQPPGRYEGLDINGASVTWCRITTVIRHCSTSPMPTSTTRCTTPAQR